MADIEEISRSSIAAWNANDWDAFEICCDPGIVIRAPEEWPESGEFEGWPAVRAQFERLKEGFVEDRIEIVGIETSADDLALVHCRWIARGASGLPMDLETWLVNRFSGDRIARTEYYLDEASARAAL